MHRLIFGAWFLLAIFFATAARAEPGAVAAPESGAKTAGAEKPTPAFVPGAKPVAAESKGQSVLPPVYIKEWWRLAAITQSDPLVFPQADFWATRENHVRGILYCGLLLGGGLAAAATYARLATDHWTDMTKWSVVGGASVAALSLITAWVFSPDRDDLLTVINQWNLRHPDRPLAP